MKLSWYEYRYTQRPAKWRRQGLYSGYSVIRVRALLYASEKSKVTKPSIFCLSLVIASSLVSTRELFVLPIFCRGLVFFDIVLLLVSFEAFLMDGRSRKTAVENLPPSYSRPLSLPVLILASFAALALSACETPESISFSAEHPELWQSHLKKSEVSPNSLPFHSSIYVPVYSHIYFENRKRLVELAETVSFRNTDEKHELVIASADYYGSDGKKVRSYLAEPIVVGPMATADFVVSRTDIAGGTGANFLINWAAGEEISDPLVEAVMVSCGPSRNLSFVSRGQVLKHWRTDTVSPGVPAQRATAPAEKKVP